MQGGAFELFSPQLQQWIYRRGWTSLNQLQEEAAAPILEHKNDVVLSAATASGKTEAAFLPAVTYVQRHPAPGLRILYVSPLKALINDQYQRLEFMCQDTGIAVTPWHGDISESRKKKLAADPQGIVLITPESLESIMMNRHSLLRSSSAHLDYIIIDEFHAFMGTQRGCQLISQLHRLDNIAGRHIVRIALSATFSNITSIKDYLRPNCPEMGCVTVAPAGMHQDILSVQLRGYVQPMSEPGLLPPPVPDAWDAVAADIFRLLRGSNNLVFANSRSRTEEVAAKLTSLCEKKHVPNEFFPHHGSLAKDLRENLEHRLQHGQLPTTAVCTSTLELGIDISDVESIGQIEPPLSVASLRQRLGRSGRRSRRAVLRLFVPEISDESRLLTAQLAEDTFLSTAMVKLLLQRWYEPPLTQQYNFSVLVQQTLSVIAAAGSVSAKHLWELLCRRGPFFMTSSRLYASLLRSLAQCSLITQLDDGTLAIGEEGEKLCSHWNFYAAFKTDDDYSIEHDHKEIGRVPLSRPPQVTDTFVFAGKAWEVTFVSRERKIIGVKPYRQRSNPLQMGEGVGLVNDEVVAQMKKLYLERECPPFLNRQAREHFTRGLVMFEHYDLAHSSLVQGPMGLALFPFLGSKALYTIMLMLRREMVTAETVGQHLELSYCSPDNLKNAVYRIIDYPPADLRELVSRIKNVEENKFDEFLSRELNELDFVQRNLDFKGAMSFFRRLKKEL